MNIGTWPLPIRDLTTAQLQCREATSEENQRLFWTKAVLQATPYEEKRYRQIAANASERILQEESEKGSSKATGLVRLPSTVAVSFSETNTRQSTSSNHRSTPSSIPLRSDTRKKSSHTRFSCYVKSHQTSKDASKKVNQKRPMASSKLRSQNNNHHCDGGHRMSIASPKKILKLTQHCRANLCNSCSKLIQTNVTQLSSTLLCQTCLHLIRSSNQLIAVKPVGLSKADEKELRHIIEGVVEEFQDQFGQALNLSIKQLSQHLLSNINLFYSHYQQEFEQLTKKYRLTFLERFVQLMNKCQTKSNSSIQAIKPSVSHRGSITHPPDHLSMSSLSGSFVTDKDLSETLAYLTTPSNSISLSTTSNRSINMKGEKNPGTNRQHPSIDQSSSKKTFTRSRNTPKPQSTSTTRKTTSSSLPLLDAYRFRDTIRLHSTHFSRLRAKLR